MQGNDEVVIVVRQPEVGKFVGGVKFAGADEDCGTRSELPDLADGFGVNGIQDSCGSGLPGFVQQFEGDATLPLMAAQAPHPHAALLLVEGIALVTMASALAKMSSDILKSGAGPA